MHQTHYEKSDWLRAFNQFTMACELHMINAISTADIAFIMSSSTSACMSVCFTCDLARFLKKKNMVCLASPEIAIAIVKDCISFISLTV